MQSRLLGGGIRNHMYSGKIEVTLHCPLITVQELECVNLWNLLEALPYAASRHCFYLLLLQID